MNTKPLILLFSVLLAYSFVAAAEEAPVEKKKFERKTDSPVAIIAALPVVKQWMEWEADHQDDSNFDIWGEDITTIDGVKCSEVAVGEVFKNQSNVWKRFCVKQSDFSVWVEKDAEVDDEKSNQTKKILPSKTEANDDSDSQTRFVPYQKWIDECKPTNNSPGIC